MLRGGGVDKVLHVLNTSEEAANLRVFVGMVKGDAKLKIFHSMIKYNDLFVAQNISGKCD